MWVPPNTCGLWWPVNHSSGVSRGVWPRPSLSQLSASSVCEVRGCSTRLNMSGEKSITQQHLSNDICVRCMLYLFQSILKQHLSYFSRGPFSCEVSCCWRCFMLAVSIKKNDTSHDDLIAHKCTTNGCCSFWECLQNIKVKGAQILLTSTVFGIRKPCLWKEAVVFGLRQGLSLNHLQYLCTAFLLWHHD